MSDVSVLLVSSDRESVMLVTAVAQDGGDQLHVVETADLGIAAIASKSYDIAFVDLTREPLDGLALIAHAQGSSGAHGSICVLVSEAEIDVVTQALSLGASGFLVTPLTGDAVERVLLDVRAKVHLHTDRVRFQEELDRARRRVELIDRLVRLAIGAGQSEAVRAIAEVLKEVSGAKGIALYATFMAARGECIRLAVIGTEGDDYPSVCGAEELFQAASRSNASMLPLEAGRGTIGFAILEGRTPGRDEEVKKTCELVGAVLSFVDGQRPANAHDASPGSKTRVKTLAYFEDVARRETKKALRHTRRLSVGVLEVAGGKDARKLVEAAVLPLLRETDVLAALDEDRLCLLLPETDGLGAHSCRRRVSARLGGERRGRGEPADAPPMDFSMGIATYPHDGASIERLLRLARARAEDDARSSARVLSLAQKTLSQIVDGLLARPMLDAGTRSLFPLDLAPPALMSVVLAACGDAARGGAAHVAVTLQPGLGLASAARQLAAHDKHARVEVFDVREREGCRDVEAIVIIAEHASWVCCGRVDKDRFSGVHAADPLLADVIKKRLQEEGGVRAG